MKAVVTGATGQCGSYLCEQLLAKGYEVYAVLRRNTQQDPQKSFLSGCIDRPQFHIARGDVTDASSIDSIVQRVRPNEFYNAAAQSHVHESWALKVSTAQTNHLGVLNCLEALKKYAPDCRFLQFSTSELYGSAAEGSQNELTRFHPRSPYANSKLAAYWATVIARESEDMFACNGIFFNMESPRRGRDFVTQKIARGIARIKKQLDSGIEVTPICLGNTQTKRDWNDARESVKYAWRILQEDSPDDFVIGSGETHTVEEFVKEALQTAGIEYQDKVNPAFGQNEFFLPDDRPLTLTSQAFFRPGEVFTLRADSSKARKALGYNPKANLHTIVEDMVHAALEDPHILLG